MLQLEQVERLALADRTAGRIDDDGRLVTPDAYRAAFDEWLHHDPERTEGALVARLMRELEVA